MKCPNCGAASDDRYDCCVKCGLVKEDWEQVGEYKRFISGNFD